MLFGNVNAAIPFLLDLFRIPADTFQLFVATSVVNARFGTLMAAMHTARGRAAGDVRGHGRAPCGRSQLLRFAVITLALTVLTVGATRTLFAVVLARPYDKDKVLASMHMLRDRGVSTQVVQAG